MTGKIKPRRLSKGQRKHARRLKQAARKTGTTLR
jgi:ribosomal protein S18